MGDLEGCFDDELLMQTAMLNIVGEVTEKVQIQKLGTQTSDAHSRVKISVPNPEGGKDAAELRQDWTYKGRIFEALNEEYEIKLSLTVTQKLEFKFIAKRLDKVMDQARADVVSHVRKGLADAVGWQVFEGSLSA